MSMNSLIVIKYFEISKCVENKNKSFNIFIVIFEFNC